MNPSPWEWTPVLGLGSYCGRLACQVPQKLIPMAACQWSPSLAPGPLADFELLLSFLARAMSATPRTKIATTATMNPRLFRRVFALTSPFFREAFPMVSGYLRAAARRWWAMASAPRAARKAAAGASRGRLGPVKRTEAKRSSDRWCSAIIR